MRHTLVKISFNYVTKNDVDINNCFVGYKAAKTCCKASSSTFRNIYWPYTPHTKTSR